MGALNLSASLRYERLIPLASSMTYGSWLALAADLRAEASQYADDRARKLFDRAEDCEYRADRIRLRSLECSTCGAIHSDVDCFGKAVRS